MEENDGVGDQIADLLAQRISNLLDNIEDQAIYIELKNDLQTHISNYC